MNPLLEDRLFLDLCGEIPPQKERDEFLFFFPYWLHLNGNKPIDWRLSGVIIQYYGLNGLNKKSYKKIGIEYGVGKEQIRRIISRAMLKMRQFYSLGKENGFNEGFEKLIQNKLKKI